MVTTQCPSALFKGDAERLAATANALIIGYSITVDELLLWMRKGAELSNIGVRSRHLNVEQIVAAVQHATSQGQ